MYAWFNEYEAFLKDKQITSADQIFNCDESGFPLQTGTSMKVCCDRQIRRNFQITSNSKTSITSLQCICANGTVIPPAILYPGVNFNPEYGIGFPKNFFLGFTKNGWMETSQFYAWLSNHFVKRIPPIRPVVLLIDGHASHIDYHTSLFCANNGIYLFRFPPHTSHALQPTDRGFFSVFKSNFSKEVAKFSLEHPGVTITKRTFPTIFSRAYDVSCSADTVKSSFRTTGIWPVDRLKVDHDLFNPSKVYTDAEPINFEVQRTFTNDINKIINNLDNAPDETVVPESTQSSSKVTELLQCSHQGNIAPLNTIPGGSKSAIEASPLKTSTPNTDNVHPVLRALRELEKVIGNKKHLYMNRHIEGYDVPEDSLYKAWRVLYQDWENIKESIRVQSFSDKSSFDENANIIINTILKYPSVERNPKSAKKKLEIPKHMTSEEALAILKLQDEEKRRVQLVKEANRQKKIAKSTTQTSKKSCQRKEKKTKTVQRKTTRQRKKPKILIEEDSSVETISMSEESEYENSEYEESDNICASCAEEFIEGELWLRCDNCSKWYHSGCTDQRKKNKKQLDCLESWRCC